VSTTAAPRRMVRGYKNLKPYNGGLGETRTRELIAAGQFPAPVKPGGEHGRTVAWFEDELIQYQSRLVEQRDARAAQAKAAQTGDGDLSKFRHRRPRSSIHVRGH
jgi:predicted DNA-binding transcriptional regulator AlpA